MSLLSRLQVARTPLRLHVANAKRLNIPSSVCDVTNSVEPLQWKGHLRNEKAKNVFRDIETATVSQVKSAWTRMHAMNFTTFNAMPKQDGNTEVFREGPPGHWMPNIYQKERLLDGLFSFGRHSISEHFKQCLGPWSPRYAGFQLVPARHYCIPINILPLPVPDNPLGNTFAMDLGPDDQLKLQKIAYKELKAHLKTHKISYKKRSNKVDETGAASSIFGTSLDFEAAKDIKENRITRDLQIPNLLYLMLDFINENGMTKKKVFAVEGHSGRMKALMVKILQDKNRPDFAIPPGTDAHDVATLALGYIKHLPVPLMASEKIDVYPNLQNINFVPHQVRALNLFILSMNQPHRDTLHMLLTTLYELLKNNTTTQLNIETLATIFGANIFRLSQKASLVDVALRQIDWVYLTKAMIYNHKTIFLVESDLMLQLRSDAKGKGGFPWSLGKKKDKGAAGPPQPVPASINIKVSAPSLPRTELTLQFTPQTKAGDVVHSYLGICKKDGEIPDTKWQLRLFEVGGNIGERCLGDNVLVSNVYQANPKAEFVVKEKVGMKPSSS